MRIANIILFITAMMVSPFLMASSIDSLSDSFISIDNTIDKGKGDEECEGPKSRC